MAATVNNYTLGRGEVHFAQFRPGTLIPRGERYLGNTPAFAITATQENLDHYSSDRGVRVKDASVLLQLDYTGSLTTDNVDLANLSYFFLGDKVTTTNVEVVVPSEVIPTVEQGLSYQLGTSTTNPAGVRGITGFVLKSAGDGASTTYVAGKDYVIDPALGRVTIMDGGAIKDGSSPVANYTIAAATRDIVIAKSKTIEGSLRYLAKNPEGAQINYFMPQVKLTPNGDYALKGDDWQALTFNIEIIKKGALEAIYLDGQPYDPAA